MRGEVTCSTTNGPVQVPATLSAHLATHRDLVDGEYRPRESTGWTVTHIATGFAIEWCNTQREARAFVEWAESEHGDELAVLAALKFGKGPGKRGKIGKASKRLWLARQERRWSAA
jgi:hypothetical protein